MEQFCSLYPEHHLTFKPQPQRPRGNGFVGILQPATQFENKIYVPDNHINNVCHSLKTRVLSIVDSCSGELKGRLLDTEVTYRSRILPVASRLKNIIKTLPMCEPMEADEFVSLYTGSKRLRYAKASQNYLTNGLNEDSFRVEAFVKNEKLLKDSVRLIQPTSFEVLYATGVYIRPAELPQYFALSKLHKRFRGKTVAKGRNAQQRAEDLLAKWNSFEDPIALGIDGEKFDFHIKSWCKEVECSLIQAHFSENHYNRIHEAMRPVGPHKVTAMTPQGRLKWVTDHGRFSGAYDTSLSNSTQMTMLLVCYFEHINVKFDLYLDGDDAVVFMERANYAKTAGISQYMLSMGFRITLEGPYYEFPEIEFCHAHPIRLSDDTAVMVRNYQDSKVKDYTCLLSINRREELCGWLTAIGKCGLSLSSGVPILKQFYTTLLSMGEGVVMNRDYMKDSGFAQLAQGMKFQELGVTELSRYDFYVAFGISPDEQMVLEKDISPGWVCDMSIENKYSMTSHVEPRST